MTKTERALALIAAVLFFLLALCCINMYKLNTPNAEYEEEPLPRNCDEDYGIIKDNYAVNLCNSSITAFAIADVDITVSMDSKKVELYHILTTKSAYDEYINPLYYNLLTDPMEMIVYKIMLYGLENGYSKISIPYELPKSISGIHTDITEITYELMYEIWIAISCDYPMLSSNSLGNYRYFESSIETSITLSKEYAKATKKSVKIIETTADIVKSLTKKFTTDEEKAQSIYYWLVANHSYVSDYKNLYDFIYNGSGNCDTFSSQLVLMLQLAGINSAKVIMPGKPCGHAITVARIDGKMRFFDASSDAYSQNYLNGEYNYYSFNSKGLSVFTYPVYDKLAELLGISEYSSKSNSEAA